MSNAPTYTAHIVADETGPTLAITKDVRGGICGPFGEECSLSDLSLAFAARELERQGFDLAGPWSPSVAYDGLRLSAPLARR